MISLFPIYKKRLSTIDATDISVQWDKGKAVGIKFRVIKDNFPLVFKLPVNVDAVEKLFLSLRKNKRLTNSQGRRLREQAEKTAWKSVSDLIDINVSHILTEQATLIQLFLGSAYDVEKDITLFERYEVGGFKQLAGGNTWKEE